MNKQATYIFIMDTSAIIHAKKVIGSNRQWEFFERLKRFVVERRLGFPKEVRDELRQEVYHDTPETWGLHVYEHMLVQNPTLNTFIEVMDRVGSVVDKQSEKEEADPYVLAQALEVQRDIMVGNAMVVTQDHQDRLPRKMALTTACQKLGIAYCSLEDFLEMIGFHPEKGWG